MMQVFIAALILLNAIFSNGNNCYGITDGHATAHNVVRHGIVTYFTVNYDGMYDRVATVRSINEYQRIGFNAIVCNRTLDVIKWWRR